MEYSQTLAIVYFAISRRHLIWGLSLCCAIHAGNTNTPHHTTPWFFFPWESAGEAEDEKYLGYR